MCMKFEKLQVGDPKHDFVYGSVYRSPVPGGWIICVFWNTSHVGGPSVTFYPEPEHKWDGSSLPSVTEGSGSELRPVA